jgi:ABC-type glycerol-3-phosphate transport system permease component
VDRRRGRSAHPGGHGDGGGRAGAGSTFALVLIDKDELKTLAIGINDFFHMAVVDWGLIMAAGVMVTIPALIFFVAVQRYLIAGWGAGGLKG